MLKDYNKTLLNAIIISVVLHLFIALALIYSSIKSSSTHQAILQQPATQKKQTIKSFLYSKPRQVVKKQTDSARPVRNVIKKHALPIETTNKNVANIDKQVTQTQKVEAKTLATHNSQSNHTATTVENPKPIKRFSSYGNIANLRKSLDNKNRMQAFSESNQHRSLSAMHENPMAVPKTHVPLTRDEKKALNTSRTHVSAITKNDNGTCTIRREQMLGSPVLASTAHFACGESKFDRNFRLHMKDVSRKITNKK